MDAGLGELIGTAIASAASAIGINEVRNRWLKESCEKNEKRITTLELSHEVHKEKVSEKYMTKEETLQMYGLLNQVTEQKLDSLTSVIHEIKKDIRSLVEK